MHRVLVDNLRTSGLLMMVLQMCSSAMLWCVSGASGQTLELETMPGWSSGPANFTTSMAWGDVDGDGDLDLVCGNTSSQRNTLYENVEGFLSETPSWLSEPANSTLGVAMGDVDGDGDLDLVCGNFNHSVTLYENLGSIFSETPQWSSGPTHIARCVALGDVDGDGDLDLVCGNLDQSNTLYENEGGTFSTIPNWSSIPANSTLSVAWGDVDGDNDLDLVCGNIGSNTLYENVDGTLSANSNWFPMPTNDTRSVAWGDVDGDGDLDLVCGNTEGSRLYENVDGALSTTPSWASGEVSSTYSVALGDVDADGDLDLACGNLQSDMIFENVDGVLAATPSWTAGITISTSSVILGDVDADGDLDLACGNSFNNRLYLNEGSALSGITNWSSEPTNYTTSVAWGDIDADGDLDLVCGNDGSSVVYDNLGGSLEAVPSWSSGATKYTLSVALGDVDGDGDLDLACGNQYEGNTLYENVGGVFSSSSIWSPAQVYDTSSVAWGDVDGDGDLDLACGNLDDSNALYENVDGVLSATPGWHSGSTHATTSVAWGDIDGDGDLDLACGNFGSSNALYENVDGMLSANPCWSSGAANSTRSVVWGDVDGDGDLDLVCGNGDHGATLYENEGGTLSTAPSWTSGLVDNTSAVVLADVDGDGDPDLVCGNYGAPNTLYENVEGTLSAVPSWVSGPANFTGCVALGDVNGDGDLDLVCGNWNAPNTLYFGLRAPVFKGSTTAPVNYLANNGAHLRFVEFSIVPPVADNLRRVDFQAIDVESDDLYVFPQFQFEGESVWKTVESVEGSSRLGAFASSPEGVAGSFVWNIEQFPADSRNVELRLLVSEIPSRVSIIQNVAPYGKQLGRIEPRRPDAFVESGNLQFGFTTVGDTTSVIITLENRGNEVLVVSSVDLPSPEMILTSTIPFEIPSGSSTELTVSLAPTIPHEINGEILIHSNDPFDPTIGIALDAEVLPLDFDTELLREQEVIPLGEAATVIVVAAANVMLERGTLYYRTLGESTFSVRPLIRTDAGFSGIVPGTDIREQGLEYYVEMENSSILAVDPPGAPADSLFYQAVQAPTTISATAIPNVNEGFLQGQAITINAELSQGSGFLGGALNFRRGGEFDYQSIPLTGEPLVLSASIPSDLASTRGLEYYVEIQTYTSTLTDPPLGPSRSPHTIVVTVLDMEEPARSPGNAFRMVSIPMDFGADIQIDYHDWEDLLYKLPEFGIYDPSRWRVFRYDPIALGYQELDPDSEQELFRLAPGNAYWLICHQDHQIGIGDANGYSTSTDSSYAVTLVEGWNQVGNPFCFPVTWDSCLVNGLSVAEAADLFDGPIHLDPDTGYGDPVAVLEPFDGYWILNTTDSDLTLQVPPREAPPVETEKLKRHADGWTMDIAVTTELAIDLCNRAGVHLSALAGFDRFDRAEAPMSPGQAIALYFPHGEWHQHGRAYTADFRPEQTAKDAIWGHAFRFDVAKNYTDDQGNEVTLTFSGLQDVPDDATITLVDHHLGQTVDLKQSTSYLFPLGKRDPVHTDAEARFTLLVGSEDFVIESLPLPPVKTALFQNYPNPFNPSTIIRFDVAHPCRASLRIYDLSGALVRTLFDDHAVSGGYELPWYGRDEAGRRMASGVYFARLQTDDGFVKTNKLVMVQ